jgi:hypothetical protein
VKFFKLIYQISVGLLFSSMMYGSYKCIQEDVLVSCFGFVSSLLYLWLSIVELSILQREV